MFGLIQKVLIEVSSFSRSSRTKCMSLSNEQCKTRLTLINLNTIEL